MGTNVAGSSYMTTMIEVREVYGEFQNEASFYISSCISSPPPIVFNLLTVPLQDDPLFSIEIL